MPISFRFFFRGGRTFFLFHFFVFFSVAFIYIVLHNTDRRKKYETKKRDNNQLWFGFVFLFAILDLFWLIASIWYYAILYTHPNRIKPANIELSLYVLYINTDKNRSKVFYDVIFDDMRLITQSDRGVSYCPKFVVNICLFVVISLLCLYFIGCYALHSLHTTRHSTHICLPTIPQKQTNKKAKKKTKTMSYMGIPLFVLIAIIDHEWGLRVPKNELCVVSSRRKGHTILFSA